MTEHHKEGLERRTRGPDPAPCSRRPPIPNFCHRYPEHHFLSQYCIRAQTLAFPVAVKSRIPLMFSRFPNSGADPHRFPPFYGNQWHFSHNNTFLIIKTHSTLKSGQYPVWMTRKPRKGEFRSKNPNKFARGARPPDPSRILHRRRSFRKSVSIYPRSAPATVFWSIPDPGKLFQTLHKGYHLRLLILTLSFRFLLRYMVRYF